MLGNVVSGLGTQAALVALPYQLYVETGSAFLTGLLGAVELVPLVAMALLGGALAGDDGRRPRVGTAYLVDALSCLAMTFGMPRALLPVLAGEAPTTPAREARACCSPPSRSGRPSRR